MYESSRRNKRMKVRRKTFTAGQGRDRQLSHRRIPRKVLFAAGARGSKKFQKTIKTFSINQFIITDPSDTRDWTRTWDLAIFIPHVTGHLGRRAWTHSSGSHEEES